MNVGFDRSLSWRRIMGAIVSARPGEVRAPVQPASKFNCPALGLNRNQPVIFPTVMQQRARLNRMDRRPNGGSTGRKGGEDVRTHRPEQIGEKTSVRKASRVNPAIVDPVFFATFVGSRPQISNRGRLMRRDLAAIPVKVFSQAAETNSAKANLADKSRSPPAKNSEKPLRWRQGACSRRDHETRKSPALSPKDVTAKRRALRAQRRRRSILSAPVPPQKPRLNK